MFALLVALAWVLAAAELLVPHWSETAVTLHDTDDAMRLVEMREFIAGQGWYDMHEARVLPPAGMDSHWSRLIDAGLADVFLLARTAFDAPMAERLTRALWPLLWLLPCIAGIAAIAWRVAGREAAVVTLLFAVLGLPAFTQFPPGRIDHHNVQIALAVLVVAATVWSDRSAWPAWAAGILTGLALAIGLEGVPYAALCAAAFGLRYAAEPGAAAAFARYGLAAAASAVAALMVDVAPAHWTTSVCDMIAFNSAAAVVAGGLVAALAGRFRALAGAPARWALVALAGLAAVAVYAICEPRCLAGPFAMVDPAIRPIWFDRVQEMQPLLGTLVANPLTGLWFAVYPVVALAGLVVLAAGPAGRAARSDPAFLTLAAALLLAIAVMLVTVKGGPYAQWLAIPAVAALAVRLWERLGLDRLVPRFLLALALAPAVVTGAALAVAAAAGRSDAEDRDAARQRACFATANYAPLAALPPGLVVAPVDLGPFLLALTPHAVVAAPYHRAPEGILAAQEAFALPPEEARAVLRRVHADYLVTCGMRPPAGLDARARDVSLWGRLRAGEVPGWLAPVAATAGGPLVVYRVAQEGH